MSPIAPLDPDRLYRACDTGHFTFTTTAELDDLSEGIGQMRAIDAAHFGIGMRHAGYNLYVMGLPGSGKRYLVRQLLDQRVGKEAKPADWCYVHNFSQPHKPHAIHLPTGMGVRFHEAEIQLVAVGEVERAAAAIAHQFCRRTLSG